MGLRLINEFKLLKNWVCLKKTLQLLCWFTLVCINTKHKRGSQKVMSPVQYIYQHSNEIFLTVYL